MTLARRLRSSSTSSGTDQTGGARKAARPSGCHRANLKQPHARARMHAQYAHTTHDAQPAMCGHAFRSERGRASGPSGLEGSSAQGQKRWGLGGRGGPRGPRGPQGPRGSEGRGLPGRLRWLGRLGGWRVRGLEARPARPARRLWGWKARGLRLKTRGLGGSRLWGWRAQGLGARRLGSYGLGRYGLRRLGGSGSRAECCFERIEYLVARSPTRMRAHTHAHTHARMHTGEC